MEDPTRDEFRSDQAVRLAEAECDALSDAQRSVLLALHKSSVDTGFTLSARAAVDALAELRRRKLLGKWVGLSPFAVMVGEVAYQANVVSLQEGAR